MTALYIGGAHSGKTALARKKHTNAVIVEHLEQRVWNAMQAGQDTRALLQFAIGKIVICDEVGCGIVPMDAVERDWRDAVGALCCEIAEHADLVVRVTAGLPQIIKGAYE